MSVLRVYPEIMPYILGIFGSSFGNKAESLVGARQEISNQWDD